LKKIEMLMVTGAKAKHSGCNASIDDCLRSVKRIAPRWREAESSRRKSTLKRLKDANFC
jgi:hypothetical protein